MGSSRSWRPPSFTLSFLFALVCSLSLTAANSVQANYDFPNYKAFEYDKPVTLQCNISGTPNTPFGLRWYKEDKVIEPLADKYNIIESENKLVILKTSDEDVANYTCQAVNRKTNTTESVMKATIQLVGIPKISLAEDTSVVEGERLTLHCSVRGKPTPLISWSVDDQAVNTSDSRIRYESEEHVKEAFLIIENVQMSDRHHYKCKAQNVANQELLTEKVTYVRVKDKLAALWPFLGICLEVAVLCTIILIYEKKRNKTELDESDTDQSPEQKNTPDHGKDVRQRK